MRDLSKAHPLAGVRPVSDCSSIGGEDVLSRGLGIRQTYESLVPSFISSRVKSPEVDEA